MANYQENFKFLVGNTSSELKRLSFKKKGFTWIFVHNNNWGIIEVQKSRDNTPGIIKFTVNLGIVSGVLFDALDKRWLRSQPSIEISHWKQRIDFLTEGKDHWWYISDDTSLNELLEISETIIKTAIPFIDNFITDESLMTVWLAGRCEGITEYQRYIYLTTLLKKYKRPEFTEVVEQFEKYGKKVGMYSQA